MNLETKTQKAFLVINSPKKNIEGINDLFSKINQLSAIGITYYAIIHDRDVDSGGVIKTPHIHLIMCRSTRSRLITFINLCNKVLDIPMNCYSIMECDDLCACVQYLIHKNDSNKISYAPFDIISNDNSNNLNRLLTQDLSSQEFTFERLGEIAVKCGFNKLLIMRTIGIGRYNAFRNSISDFLPLFREEYEDELLKNGAYDTLNNV